MCAKLVIMVMKSPVNMISEVNPMELLTLDSAMTIRKETRKGLLEDVVLLFVCNVSKNELLNGLGAMPDTVDTFG